MLIGIPTINWIFGLGMMLVGDVLVIIILASLWVGILLVLKGVKILCRLK